MKFFALAFLISIFFADNLAAEKIVVEDSQGKPVENALLACIPKSSDKISKAKTNKLGIADIQYLPDTENTLFCSHPEFNTWVEKDYDFKTMPVIRLKSSKNLGSIIFLDGNGEVPGLNGTLTTILDHKERLLIFSDEISFNNRNKKLIKTRLRKSIFAKDLAGNTTRLKVIEAIGDCWLIEYSKIAEEIQHKKSPEKTVANQVIDEFGKPINSAKIYYVHRVRKTYLEGRSDSNGEFTIDSPRPEEVSVFCVHPDYRAYKKDGHRTNDKLTIRLVKHNQIGSIVCPRGTGHVPGLEGRLNPILDSLNRMYLYADNVSIDGGKQQPAVFRLNHPIRAEDAHGNLFLLQVIDIVGRISLLEYQQQ